MRQDGEHTRYDAMMQRDNSVEWRCKGVTTRRRVMAKGRGAMRLLMVRHDDEGMASGARCGNECVVSVAPTA
ncbi:hypothetical protein GUJ93_ZPchr0006g41017 [Zizania palustris]|uniref:Uncharacterized protein n=1 Tax=Zizania palustris TaxID=103762 RepID=A0A8J5VSB0_ZIZPA|nr:hypothetical protein GUJ93_ZPchr0006g41017 [Zizania palustris]